MPLASPRLLLEATNPIRRYDGTMDIQTAKRILISHQYKNPAHDAEWSPIRVRDCIIVDGLRRVTAAFTLGLDTIEVEAAS